MFQARATTEDRAIEALRAQARRSAAHQLKQRARNFAKRPIALEALFPGLAAAHGRRR